MEPLELFEHALTAPLDDLIVPSVQVMPPTSIKTWQLPATDLEAYQRWGLPIVEATELQPSFDRVIEDEDQVYYRLCAIGEDDLVTAADTGTVEGFCHLEGAAFPRYWINGSGALFVDTAWRWYGVNTALRAAPFEYETYDRLDRFFALVQEKDPTVGENSLWHSLVEGW
ncbi:hypothetical protein [Lentzea sp. NPDC004782]|uniref:hypothetical protein n=1 Tax=Lentzea sp. NPDC004782 TaxID=3154458 RepID=UPI0033BD0B18